MKNVSLCAFAVCTFFFIGCGEAPRPARPEKPLPAPPDKGPEKVPYPFARSITNIEGRSIEASILGKETDQLAFAKGSGVERREFVISLGDLMQVDQDYFNGIEDGGAVSETREALLRKEKCKSRVVRWHNDALLAERECAKYDIPLFLLVVLTNDEESKALDSLVGYSQELKDWAKDKVVLCRLAVDPTGSKHTTSIAAVQNRKVALSYRVGSSSPCLRIVDKSNDLNMDVNVSSLRTAKEVIEKVDRLIR